MHWPEKLGFFHPYGRNTYGNSSNETMVLFTEIRVFCIKTKNPMHRLEKVGFFPPLMIPTSWNTYGGN